MNDWLSYQSLDSANTEDCLKYISQPTFDSSSKSYKGSFNPPPNLMLEGQSQPNGLLLFGLSILVTDPTFNSTEFGTFLVGISNYSELN